MPVASVESGFIAYRAYGPLRVGVKLGGQKQSPHGHRRIVDVPSERVRVTRIREDRNASPEARRTRVVAALAPTIRPDRSAAFLYKPSSRGSRAATLVRHDLTPGQFIDAVA